MGEKSLTCFGRKFWPVKLFFSSRFCQFLLSFFVFFYYFSFIFPPFILCVHPFFCHMIFFCTSISFPHLFCIIVCVKCPSIHNWIEQIYIIYIFYHSSHFSFQLNKWVLYSFNFLAPNQSLSHMVYLMSHVTNLKNTCWWLYELSFIIQDFTIIMHIIQT